MNKTGIGSKDESDERVCRDSAVGTPKLKLFFLKSKFVNFQQFFCVHLSHMEREDFEDVVLGDSDGDGNNSPDDFEDIKYAEENDPYRTKRCPCPCHQEMITKRNREGIRHCYNCCLKVYPTSHISFSFSFSFLFVCILQRENVCVCVCFFCLCAHVGSGMKAVE